MPKGKAAAPAAATPTGGREGLAGRGGSGRKQGRTSALATAQKKERNSTNPTPTMHHFMFGAAGARLDPPPSSPPRAGAQIDTWDFTGFGNEKTEQRCKIGDGIHYIFHTGPPNRTIHHFIGDTPIDRTVLYFNPNRR